MKKNEGEKVLNCKHLLFRELKIVFFYDNMNVGNLTSSILGVSLSIFDTKVTPQPFGLNPLTKGAYSVIPLLNLNLSTVNFLQFE